jgi:hypothetical protein
MIILKESSILNAWRTKQHELQSRMRGTRKRGRRVTFGSSNGSEIRGASTGTEESSPEMIAFTNEEINSIRVIFDMAMGFDDEEDTIIESLMTAIHTIDQEHAQYIYNKVKFSSDTVEQVLSNVPIEIPKISTDFEIERNDGNQTDNFQTQQPNEGATGSEEQAEYLNQGPKLVASNVNDVAITIEETLDELVPKEISAGSDILPQSERRFHHLDAISASSYQVGEEFASTTTGQEDDLEGDQSADLMKRFANEYSKSMHYISEIFKSSQNEPIGCPKAGILMLKPSMRTRYTETMIRVPYVETLTILISPAETSQLVRKVITNMGIKMMNKKFIRLSDGKICIMGNIDGSDQCLRFLTDPFIQTAFELF